MKPTPKLRFVARDVFVGNSSTHTERVLQQWWKFVPGEYQNKPDGGEWRDVPLEREV